LTKLLTQPPTVGLGLWKIANDQAAQAVEAAIEIGYRHIDSASDYGNESFSGEGIAAALSKKAVTRDELWVTSKLWNTNHRSEHVRAACEKSLQDLQVDYLDLYLIHFPISLKYVDPQTRYPAGWFYDPEATNPKMEVDAVPIRETWEAMQDLVKAGLVRQIGVSNFNVSLIRDILSYATIRPSVLQVESHPYLVQSKLLRYCQSESIHMTAFSPLGAPSYVSIGMATEADSVLTEPTVLEIAREIGCTPAQAVLAWGIQRGTSVIPKTTRPTRLQENLDSQRFLLSNERMQSIQALDRARRFNDPGVFCEQAFGGFYPIYE
jgi:D-xylose reductase